MGDETWMAFRPGLGDAPRYFDGRPASELDGDRHGGGSMAHQRNPTLARAGLGRYEGDVMTNPLQTTVASNGQKLRGVDVDAADIIYRKSLHGNDETNPFSTS